MQRVFICGSALQGQPDHGNVAATHFAGAVNTQPRYRMHAVGNGWHPGVYETETDGVSLAGELYEMTAEQYEALLASEPPGLYPGQVELSDGRMAIAMIYPYSLIEKHQWPDISHFGGWAAYKASAPPRAKAD
ncbi:MAG: gamma-glutamylcyclotransferase [Cyanophyceae cyanobacterium]